MNAMQGQLILDLISKMTDAQGVMLELIDFIKVDSSGKSSLEATAMIEKLEEFITEFKR